MGMPKQKPGRSKQNYQTPPELLYAIKQRLCIGNFDIDLAASAANTVAINYYDEEMDALSDRNEWMVTRGGWAFCNPPFGHIEPWVKKAAREAMKGAHIAMLVPASPGANWWAQHVEAFAYQSFLNGRLTFGGTPINPKTGKPDVYPKDCAILLYTPWGFIGHEIWYWKNRLENNDANV